MPMFLGRFHVHTSARHHGGQRRYRQTATAEQHRLGFGDELESNNTKINSWRAGVRAQDQQYLEMGSTGGLEPGSTLGATRDPHHPTRFSRPTSMYSYQCCSYHASHYEYSRLRYPSQYAVDAAKQVAPL
ncbi:hypothetical protein CFAM422_005489 [Trichoderma lentiforme]|uniref:Uncharacterized protein n=1 Tax=Trichoderma lentiforme TaxID=1567552 RepID=A0A9P4XEZ7_9HYPO|nr:hypothetical protein CFAM422_005489 [Trichoderma lentiforme]